MKIIITDLTRFSNDKIYCTAGVADDGTVYRPQPYLTAAECKRLDVQPGGILEGTLKLTNHARPHVEDADWKNLSYKGKCTGEQFKEALDLTLYESISDGFEHKVSDKSIPESEAPPRSLITIKVDPEELSIVKDGFSAGRLRVHLTDAKGLELRYLSITDLGFFNYAKGHAASASDIAEVNEFIRSQDELYVRIGLGRAFENCYWLQVNGIYTFPEYRKDIRLYT